MKVSVDFDDTLEHPSVQRYIKRLILRGHDVWIVTSRADGKIGYGCSVSGKNDDLFAIADHLQIPRNKIHFTNGSFKADFFKDNMDFVLHLEDDEREIQKIREHTTVATVNPKKSYWIRKCEEVIQSKETTKE